MATRYLVATGTWNNVNTAIWSGTSGGAPGASPPGSGDAVIFDAASGAVTVTIGSGPSIASLDCTGFTGTLNAAGWGITLYGSPLTLSAGMTLANTGAYLVYGNCSITCAGQDLRWLYVGTASPTVNFLDDFAASFVIDMSSGTLNANNHNVRLGTMNVGDYVRSPTINMGSGTWTLDAAFTTSTNACWNTYSTGSIVNADTSTLRLLQNAAAGQSTQLLTDSIAGAKTFYNILVAGTGAGAGTEVLFIGDVVCNNLTIETDSTVPIWFSDGSTFTLNTLTVNGGSAGNLVPFGRPAPGTLRTFTLSCTSGVIVGNYMDIRGSQATGGATFIAQDSLDSGDNTGWIFAVPLSEPTLQQVVERQCLRAGLSYGDIDASALSTRNVRAMVVSNIASPRQVIETLMAAYGFTCVESEVLRFMWRGEAAVATIPYEDIVRAGDADSLPIKKLNDLELPVQVSVRYSNVDDDYQDGVETSDRLVSSGQNTAMAEFPIGFTPTEAKRIADFHIADAASSLFEIGPFALDRSYSHLEPGDVVTVTAHDGTQFRTRLEKLTAAAGVLTFSGRSDEASVASSVAVTSTTGYGNSTAITLPHDTALELLDAPILADADDSAGIYAAAKPATDVSFRGAALFKSSDDVTFENVGSTTSEAVFGTATTTLGSGPLGVLDEKNSLTVDVGFGELSSITRTVLLNGTTNRLLVGSEVIQFRDATLQSAGVYKLTGLLRGLRGTDWAVGTHAASERVVLLDAAVLRVPMTNTEIGVARYWKAVTLGRTTATAASESFTDNAVALKPFAPVDVRIARDASDNATITLQRRTRRATRLTGALGVSVPLGEESESYSVDVYATSGYATVKRTLTGGTPSFSYSAADQVTDFGSAQSTLYLKAHQLSAAVGRGYAATAQG